MNNYFFIVNPASGRGKGAQLGKRLQERLPELNIDWQLAFTEKQWHAADLAREAAANFGTIVVVGGDGTMHEVVNGMVGSGSALGIIPVGTGNDFVRAANVPVNFEKALAVLLRGKRKYIDLGQANGRYYHNGLGIGFDAWAVEFARKVNWLRGSAIYFYSVLKTLLRYKPVQLKLKFNGGQQKSDFYLLSIANGIALGGGFKLTPDALLDDGLFDLLLIKNMPRRSIVRNLLKVYSGKHKDDPRVDITRTNEVSLHSDEGFAIHLDGELLSLKMHEVNVKLIPKALEIIC